MAELSSISSLEVQFGKRFTSSSTMIDCGFGLALAAFRHGKKNMLTPKLSASTGNFFFFENHLFLMNRKITYCAGFQLVFPLPLDEGCDCFL